MTTLLCKITKNALPISFDYRVHCPSATVRVLPLWWMCGRVVYLCVAFPCHIAMVCEMFVNFERIFLYEPLFLTIHFAHTTVYILCNSLIWFCMQFSELVEAGALLPLGTRVKRGKDWKWNNQDTDGPGTIIQHRQKRDGEVLSCKSLREFWVASSL